MAEMTGEQAVSLLHNLYLGTLKNESRITKKIIAAVNLARTTCKSPTGVVIKVSNVPEYFSRAKSRMVIIGVARRMINQK